MDPQTLPSYLTLYLSVIITLLHSFFPSPLPRLVILLSQSFVSPISSFSKTLNSSDRSLRVVSFELGRTQELTCVQRNRRVERSQNLAIERQKQANAAAKRQEKEERKRKRGGDGGGDEGVNVGVGMTPTQARNKRRRNAQKKVTEMKKEEEKAAEAIAAEEGKKKYVAPGKLGAKWNSDLKKSFEHIYL